MPTKLVKQLAFPITITEKGFEEFLRMAVHASLRAMEENLGVSLKDVKKSKKKRRAG